MVAFAAADGKVSEQFRLPVAAGDPRPLWPLMDSAALRAHLGSRSTCPVTTAAAVGVCSSPGDGERRAERCATPATGTLPSGVVVAASLDEVVLHRSTI